VSSVLKKLNKSLNAHFYSSGAIFLNKQANSVLFVFKPEGGLLVNSQLLGIHILKTTSAKTCRDIRPKISSLVRQNTIPKPDTIEFVKRTRTFKATLF